MPCHFPPELFAVWRMTRAGVCGHTVEAKRLAELNGSARPLDQGVDGPLEPERQPGQQPSSQDSQRTAVPGVARSPWSRYVVGRSPGAE